MKAGTNAGTTRAHSRVIPLTEYSIKAIFDGTLGSRVHGRVWLLVERPAPRRAAILLIGADKTGNDRWYEEYVPRADRLYDEHLAALGKEGLNYDG